MIIKLTTSTSYDLSIETRFKNFRDNVNRMIKSGNRDPELRFILQQLNQEPSLEAKINSIKLKIEAHFKVIKNTNASGKSSKAKQPQQKPEKTKTPQWQKSGEHSFQRMYVRLIDDVRTFHGDMDFMVAYSAHVINMYMHMATVTPYQHHAAAQEREYKSGHCLQYGRSQGKHPNANLYRKFGFFDSTNRLPFNSAYYKILKDIDPKGFSVISQFNPKTGEPRKGKKPNSYANLTIAHAGLRINNLELLMKGLELAGKQQEGEVQNTILNRLMAVLPPSRKPFKKVFDLAKAFKAYHERFTSLEIHTDMTPVGKSLMSYRFGRVHGLEEKINGSAFKFISVKKTQKNTTCLFIRLYPSYKASSAAVKEGVTNTLIAIFSGILQYKLEQKKICLRAERRQSFGFLRPTLTDAGVLTMRLSLGLEPHIFDDVVMESLTELEMILTTYNFQDQSHPLVKQVLAVKNKDPKKTRQYAFIQSAVSSDRKTLNTFNQARAYIGKYAPSSFIASAVQQFLADFIIEEKELSLADSKTESSAIKGQPKEVMSLLQNTVAYARKMAMGLSFDSEHQTFQYSYYHAYQKLFKNVDESIRLLNQADRLSADKIFYQATRYIENIIEYCLLLNALNYPAKLAENPDYDPVKILRKTELDYCRHHLGVNPDQLDLFFTDSGQQAINLPMLVYGHGYKLSDTDKACIQLFGKTYFEISSFFDDIKKDNVPTITNINAKAKVLVVDITQIEILDINDYPKLAVCIIDLTHNPDVNNPALKEKIHRLLEKGVTCVLSASLLKHEQLGQDKFQSGKFFVISPDDEKLKPTREIIDEFQSVSDEAMNPYLATAFNMFNEISHVKTKVSASGLTDLGLFSSHKIQSPARSATKDPIGMANA